MMEKPESIAKNSLRKCYKKHGIVAGATHFNYFWARDSFYASWGALEIGDHKIVKKNLESFIKYQKNDGQIPLRIGATSLSQWLALAGIKLKHKEVAEYNQDKGFKSAIDPNLLFIITFHKYTKQCKYRRHIRLI